ncbi:MAG: TonB-dependent receptor [Bacteroidales bacterium]|nr:TonB-dependent receptor [Bacteroidales bacterium]
MSFRNIIALIFLCLSATYSYCQTYTVSGTVRDKDSGEKLTGANIYFQEDFKKGAASDINGKYSISSEQGTYTLVCTFIGYDTVVQQINLNKNLKADIRLKPLNNLMGGVEIKVTREDQNVRSPEVSSIEISMKRMEKIPVLFGEKDILKTIQLLPGIQAGGEGSNTFHVRGGGSDQNLILIDGATVYNPSHAAGFFSIFNSDIVNSAEVIKGGMAPEYGGRMSSVLNITTLDGDKEQFKGIVGIGLLSSRIQAEGPIQRDKSSFSFAARRTYADVVMKPFLKPNSPAKGLGTYFYDLNGKLSFQLSKKDNIFVTGYHGKDFFRYNANVYDSPFMDLNWMNTVGIIRWNHIFSKKLFLDVSANITDYQINVQGQEQLYKLQYSSGVRDYVGKADLTFTPDSLNKFKVGASYTYHIFTPTALSIKTGSTSLNANEQQKFYANDVSSYIQHDIQITPWLEVLYGLRYNHFSFVGPFKRYIIDNVYNLNNVDSIMYGRGDVIKSYNLLEPRINTRFQLSETQSVKASYTLNNQCLNLAALMDISTPTDIWLPSTDLLHPQRSHQFTVGYFQNFLDNTIETSVEVYYKKMLYLLEVNPDINPLSMFQTNLDYDFISGDGQSYGIELFANKTAGKFTGWVAYTLSWTTRNFDEIMDGKTFYARYDRRHDVSIMLNYELNKKWDFSVVWVFASGNAATIPNSYYIINGNLYIEYGEHNGWRMPDYHRLDLSANWNVFQRKMFSGILNFSIYNVYNRHNAFLVSYTLSKNEENNKIEVHAYQVSLFPILPSVAFTLKFR